MHDTHDNNSRQQQQAKQRESGGSSFPQEKEAEKRTALVNSTAAIFFIPKKVTPKILPKATNAANSFVLVHHQLTTNHKPTSKKSEEGIFVSAPVQSAFTCRFWSTLYWAVFSSAILAGI
jgi:hypothetical protein